MENQNKNTEVKITIYKRMNNESAKDVIKRVNDESLKENKRLEHLKTSSKQFTK